jgi:hypothetical protein
MNQTPGPQTHVGESNPFKTILNQSRILTYDIPEKYVGLIIGKGGETLKSVA